LKRKFIFRIIKFIGFKLEFAVVAFEVTHLWKVISLIECLCFTFVILTIFKITHSIRIHRQHMSKWIMLCARLRLVLANAHAWRTYCTVWLCAVTHLLHKYFERYRIEFNYYMDILVGIIFLFYYFFNET
jgi:hypothetical protein